MIPVSLQEREKIVGQGVEYAAAISTGVDQENPIERQIRLVNEAMINWLRKRGERAKVLAFIYIVGLDEQTMVLNATQKLVSQKLEFQNLLQNIAISVLFQEPGSQELKQYELKYQPPTKTKGPS